MAQKLFLLDGMALIYRAHFALIARPIFTSKGVNTSALYGFTQTLLDILNKQQPTHIGVAFDTEAPTQRHVDFPEYKATRQAMPEDLSVAIPHVRRILEAFRIPVISCDGYEADDLIGTLVGRAEKLGFTSYMVTPDKDFGQLVTEKVFLFKPARMGDAVEVLGVPEIRARWGIQNPKQMVDILALMGDSTDNIPGVPGIGEKTAIKLVAQYGSVEQLLEHVPDLTGRVKSSLEQNREKAILSKKLATIICNAPCGVEIDSLELRPRDDDMLKALFVEFEFNSIGKRLFGEDFKAGRGFQSQPAGDPAGKALRQTDFALEMGVSTTSGTAAGTVAELKSIAKVRHRYEIAGSIVDRRELLKRLMEARVFGMHLVPDGSDPRQARITGFGFSFEPHSGVFVPFPSEAAHAKDLLEEFRPVLESGRACKVGHDLKFELSVLRWHGVSVAGPFFDSMIAHSLVEPDLRHTLDFVSEANLGYTPIATDTVAPDKSRGLSAATTEKVADYAAERADLSLQLQNVLAPQIKARGQERVFREIELGLMPVLVEMEFEGIKVDAAVLADFGRQLSTEIRDLEQRICRTAGTEFNLNSPRQLGQILFEVMKISDAPKKTRTGQYATDEQTLLSLAPDHEIVRQLLEHRAASKLKSTYADALPEAIWPATGRVHTTYNQVMTATGRLNSQDPNLQNIPIRTERGQEIRKAFVPRNGDYVLLSADYSQIELRIIAALSEEPALLEAFKTGADVHTATAARVFAVAPAEVTSEMRRKAKMVNYGIAYGISAFGLSQRLVIPRKEASEIIEQYFKQFAGIRNYMDETIAFARQHGYAQTVTGRRRYLRDIGSSNFTVRSAAERNAINAPIQGTAADMIKLAMIHIHDTIQSQGFKTRLLLQVHDELVFDLYRTEEKQIRTLVEDKMKTAIELKVPIEVEIGVGANWLQAH